MNDQRAATIQQVLEGSRAMLAHSRAQLDRAREVMERARATAMRTGSTLTTEQSLAPIWRDPVRHPRCPRCRRELHVEHWPSGIASPLAPADDAAAERGRVWVCDDPACTYRRRVSHGGGGW